MEGSSASCSRNFGGLRSVVLYKVDDVSFGGYRSSVGFTSCSLAPEATPLEVYFADGGARYLERIDSEGGVEHHLEIVVSGLRTELLGQIRALSRQGVVAVLTLTSGRSFVVGCSPRGGADYPLRLIEAEGDSATKRSDNPTVRMLLGSKDGWSATPFSPLEL